MVETNQDPARVLSDAYEALLKAVSEEDYAQVDESVIQILALDSSERTDGAKHAKLVSLIKRREFEEALTFLNKHDFTKKNCMTEAAYILHRQN